MFTHKGIPNSVGFYSQGESACCLSMVLWSVGTLSRIIKLRSEVPLWERRSAFKDNQASELSSVMGAVDSDRGRQC